MNRARLELPLLVWGSVAVAFAVALLALSLFADVSVAVLVVVGFGGAIAMSAATGVQDGRRLRRESYAQTPTAEAEAQIWRQTIEEALEARQERESALGEVRYVLEPEAMFLEPEPVVLTKRDRALVALIAAGLPLGDIAAQLNLSRETAQREWRLLEEKLGAALRAVQARRQREEPEP